MTCPIRGTGPPPPDTGAMVSAPLQAMIRNGRSSNSRGLIRRSPLAQRASSQLDGADDFVAPGGLLAAEHPARHFYQRPGTVQREVHAPRRRHVGEVLVHERGDRKSV